VPGAGSGGGSGFDVSKSGDARVALVGFPSVGKSTFLSKITKTKSEVAAYSFTTLTAIPGVLEYGGAEIQILDLPGIIEGASEGKGRGRQVISAAKVPPTFEGLVQPHTRLLCLGTQGLSSPFSTPVLIEDHRPLI
jgi:ribosome-interacting GTPase 1